MLAVSASLEIESELIPRVATGMAGGICGTNNICGALSGGVMAMGIVMGRDNPSGQRNDISKAAKKLIQTFSNRYGDTNCWQLLGLHPTSTSEVEVIDLTVQGVSCDIYAEDVVMITMEILDEILLG